VKDNRSMLFWHFFVGLGAISYLSMGFMLLYQYAAVTMDLPGRFLTVLHDASGDWWLDIQWSHPVMIVWAACAFAAACGYAFWKRNDKRSYREPEVESQPGF